MILEEEEEEEEVTVDGGRGGGGGGAAERVHVREFVVVPRLSTERTTAAAHLPQLDEDTEVIVVPTIDSRSLRLEIVKRAEEILDGVSFLQVVPMNGVRLLLCCWLSDKHLEEWTQSPTLRCTRDKKIAAIAFVRKMDNAHDGTIAMSSMPSAHASLNTSEAQ